MPKLDVKELFQRLCGLEYEVLKYVYRTQGEKPAPVNYFEAAAALSVEKDEVRRAIKRLVTVGVLIADGEAFKINGEVVKKDGAARSDGARTPATANTDNKG